MDKRKIFDEKIDKLIKNEKVISLLLIGAGAEIERSEINSLRDIDIFVITKETYDFQREVIEIKGVLFDISYMSFDLFKKSIDKELPLVIKALNNYRLLYNINEDLQELLDKIQFLYKKGPIILKKNEVDYIRFKLYQDYKDILARQEDELNGLFLANNLFYNTVILYFKLKGFWVPKDKKILNNIQNIDNILYNLCRDFIKEQTCSSKLKTLSEILNYILKPYGGVIEFWEKGKYPLL